MRTILVFAVFAKILAGISADSAKTADPSQQKRIKKRRLIRDASINQFLKTGY